MEIKTANGLFLIILGSILSIFSTLGTVATPANSPATCLLSMFSFIVIVLILIGLIMMFMGRNEFGEEHRQFVIYAFIAFIIGIALMVIGAVLTVIGALSGVTPGTGTQEPTIDHSRMVQGMITGLIVMQFGGLVILIGEILLVFKLENELGKNLLYITLGVGIITAIITTILFYSALDEFMYTLEDIPEEDLDEEAERFENDINKFSLIGLISTILLLIAYYIPYDRIKKGELKPVVPSAIYLTPMYPPQYPYQPYPPQYPYQPYPPQYPQQPFSPQLDPNIVEVEPLAPVPSSQEEIQLKETIHCPHCGSQYPKGSKVCPVCGK